MYLTTHFIFFTWLFPYLSINFCFLFVDVKISLLVTLIDWRIDGKMSDRHDKPFHQTLRSEELTDPGVNALYQVPARASHTSTAHCVVRKKVLFARHVTRLDFGSGTCTLRDRRFLRYQVQHQLEKFSPLAASSFLELELLSTAEVHK